MVETVTSNLSSLPEKEQLCGLIDLFEGVPIVVLGDLILDHYIWGSVNRISPEAPVVVVNVTKENQVLGGGGNVAANLAALGARPYLCGVVGDDQPGRQFLEEAQHRGIDCRGVLVDRTRPTTIKTRVIAHSQQVVRIDREDTRSLDGGYQGGVIAALESMLACAKAVVISDYGKGTINPCLMECVLQKDRFGLATLPLIIDPKAPNFDTYRGATVVKPNRKEAEQASGFLIKTPADAGKVGSTLLDTWQCEMLLITLGEDGMVLVERKQDGCSVDHIETQAREVYDVSGAGDTVSAVFALALGLGASGGLAARLANYAAGIVVAEVGTVAVRKDQLLDAVRAGSYTHHE